MKKDKKTSNKKLICFALSGLIFFGIGTNLLVFKDSIISYFLNSILIITPTSIIYDLWRKAPLDIPTEFYFFNWTNKEDFYNLSVKPKFEEVGPYKIKQNLEKVNITFNDNDTVTFKQVRNFEYGDEKENGNFSDEITTINYVFMRNGDPDFDGTFNIANGLNRNFDLLSWNYYTKTPYYNDSCNEVRGSLGDFHSRKNDKKSLNVFIPEICRYVTLDFEKEVKVDGILGYKYSVQDRALDNGTNIPENECFCAGQCIPSGMLNASSCRYGLNGYGSLPHFYHADPVYLQGVQGLQPEKSKHESYIVLEPTTLIPLEFKARMQLNIYVHPVENVVVYEKAPRVFFPLFWVEQRMNLPSSLLQYLKIFLSLPFIITTFSVILILLGVFLISFSYYLTVKCEKNKFKSELVPLKMDLIEKK